MAKIANNKFNEILHLEREKVKKGFEMSFDFWSAVSDDDGHVF